MSDPDKIRSTTDNIIELGNELEAPGHAAQDDASLERARAVIGEWLASMRAVVVNPALGRVTIVQANGQPASIASSDLAFRMSAAGVIRAGG